MTVERTVPMSLATVGYALFAFQQNEPLNGLQPLVFNAAAPAAPAAAAPEELTTESAPEIGYAAPAYAPAQGGGHTGMFAPPPEVVHVVTGDPAPSEDVPDGGAGDPPAESAASAEDSGPRASVAIGLLKELSYLDG
jgi:hypothetical protein